MSNLPSLILLDTMAAAGIFSDRQEKQKKWVSTILHLIAFLPEADITIPTPVFLELAQWHVNWYKYVQNINQPSISSSPLLKYVSYSIPKKVFYPAAAYKLFCSNKQNKPDEFRKEKNKISFIDSLLASYCLTYNYALVTENHNDFPDKYFSIVKVATSPESTGTERRLLFLLKPNTEAWRNDLSRI